MKMINSEDIAVAARMRHGDVLRAIKGLLDEGLQPGECILHGDKGNTYELNLDAISLFAEQLSDAQHKDVVMLYFRKKYKT